MDDPGQQELHDAIQGYVCGEDDAVVTRWCLVADVRLADGGTTIAHRAGMLGGGGPTVTEAIGLLGGSLATAIAQLITDTHGREG